jgi:hypothetical protein
MKLSRDRSTVRSENRWPSIRTPSLRSPEGEHLFSSLHQLGESIGFILLISQQAENCNLIPQRNCDRFSRSSMDPLVSFQSFKKPAIIRSENTISVNPRSNDSQSDSPKRHRGRKGGISGFGQRASHALVQTQCRSRWSPLVHR